MANVDANILYTLVVTLQARDSDVPILYHYLLGSRSPNACRSSYFLASSDFESEPGKCEPKACSLLDT